MVDTWAYEHNLPCLNPACRSHGRPHPNCRCYEGGGGEHISFSEGGRICSGPHHKDCEYYADGGEVEANTQNLNNPDEALDHVGVEHGLLHLLTKTGSNGQSPNPHKHIQDYIESSRSGHKTVDSHISKLLSPEKLDIEPDKEGISSLKERLNELNSDPEKVLDIGGKLPEILPMHGAALGAKTANALNYFQSLKPKTSQHSPLDPVIPGDPMAEQDYDRQLGIAQNPMLILKHTKQGTLRSQDLKTLHSIYPALGQSIVKKGGEALIDAKMKGQKLSYQQKQGLSGLLGQPLDSTLNPQVMAAIIKANGQNISQTQGLPQKQKKASGVELKQINKTNDLYATQNQELQLNKKS